MSVEQAKALRIIASEIKSKKELISINVVKRVSKKVLFGVLASSC